MDDNFMAELNAENAAIKAAVDDFGLTGDSPLSQALRSVFKAGVEFERQMADKARQQEDRAGRFAGLLAAVDDRISVVGEQARVVFDYLSPETVTEADIARINGWFDRLDEIVELQRTDTKAMKGDDR